MNSVCKPLFVILLQVAVVGELLQAGQFVPFGSITEIDVIAAYQACPELRTLIVPAKNIDTFEKIAAAVPVPEGRPPLQFFGAGSIWDCLEVAFPKREVEGHRQGLDTQSHEP
jgi:ATP-dependent Lon protease